MTYNELRTWINSLTNKHLDMNVTILHNNKHYTIVINCYIEDDSDIVDHNSPVIEVK